MNGVHTEQAAWGDEDKLSNLMRKSRSSREEGETTGEGRRGKDGEKPNKVHVSKCQAVASTLNNPMPKVI